MRPRHRKHDGDSARRSVRGPITTSRKHPYYVDLRTSLLNAADPDDVFWLFKKWDFGSVAS